MIQGDVISVADWKDGILWCWWHKPQDLKGRAPIDYIFSVFGAVWVQVGKPVGDGTILIIGFVR